MFKIFRKKEEVTEVPLVKEISIQKGKNKQEIINCITSGGGECEGCDSLHKCLKMRKTLKRIGIIR